MSDKPSTYKSLKLLGKGSFGTVFLAEHTQTKERFAIKRIQNPDLANLAAGIQQQRRQNGEAASPIKNERLEAMKKRREELIAREVNIWWDLEKHPGIVTLVEAFRTDNNTYLVQELMGGGSLEDVLETCRAKRSRLKEAKMQLWFSQIANAISFLHSKGIVHRDLKPANVLLTQNWKQAKICDFGLAREHPEDGGLPTKKCGSYAYMAAEAWHGHHDGFKSDMWALGAMLYEMLTGNLPFEGNGSQLYEAITESSPPMPDYISSEAKEVVLALLQKAPKQRPTAVRLLQFPWIRKSLEQQQEQQHQQSSMSLSAHSPTESPSLATLRQCLPKPPAFDLGGGGDAEAPASPNAMNNILSGDRIPKNDDDDSCAEDDEGGAITISFVVPDTPDTNQPQSPAKEATAPKAEAPVVPVNYCPSLTYFIKVLEKLRLVVASTVTFHTDPTAKTPSSGTVKEFCVMVECASQGAICVVEVRGEKVISPAGSSHALVLKKIRGRGKAAREFGQCLKEEMAPAAKK